MGGVKFRNFRRRKIWAGEGKKAEDGAVDK